MDTEAPVCALFLGELRVDFMPDDEKILGFTNKWYAGAVETAIAYILTDQLTIRLVSPPYFIATKLEAYLGRGDGDALMSQDVEDILNLFNGRESLLDELRQVQNDELKGFIEENLSLLLRNSQIQIAIANCVQDQGEHARLLFENLSMATSLRD